MPKDDDIDDSIDGFDDDPEPIPAKRDIRIFHRKKESKDDRDEDFEEDVFI
jgi:hypothetical protein